MKALPMKAVAMTRTAPQLFACVLAALVLWQPAGAAPVYAAHAADALGDALNDAKKQLASADNRERQRAIEALARIGDASAWGLVFQKGLVDPSPRVADEAQLSIGRASVDEVLLDLSKGKYGLGAKSALVRLRVIQALGRIEGAVPLALFVRAAKDKDERVRASAWYALEQRAEAGVKALDAADAKDAGSLVKALAKAASGDKDPHARANALRCAAALPDAAWVTETPKHSKAMQAFDAWKRAARAAKQPELRAAAVALLAPDDDAGFAAALRDAAPGVVAVAVDRLAARADVSAMRVLAERLMDSELTLRSASSERIVQSLRAASGLTIGPDADRWLRWVDGLADDWRAPADEGPGRASDDAQRTTTFFGLRLVSDGVVFLVDMSGSMWDDRKGEPRKVSVDLEMAKTLASLPESARFDVVPYANAPAPWKGKLTEATPRNVDRATESFLDSKLRGKGDVWSALLPVLDDPEVDTIVILTDGAPTGGYRWNVELMRTLLADRNRHRRAVIHVVLFDAGKKLERLWRDMAKDAGGSLHLID